MLQDFAYPALRNLIFIDLEVYDEAKRHPGASNRLRGATVYSGACCTLPMVSIRAPRERGDLCAAWVASGGHDRPSNERRLTYGLVEPAYIDFR